MEAGATENVVGWGLEQRGINKPEGRKPSGPVTAGESGQGLDRDAQAPGSRNLSLANISRRQRPTGDSSQWRYVIKADQRPNSSCESGQSPRCYLQRVRPYGRGGDQVWELVSSHILSPLGVIWGPQAPAAPAWAECRLVVPTGRLCQGGDPTMPWESGWAGALKNMPLCLGSS